MAIPLALLNPGKRRGRRRNWSVRRSRTTGKFSRAGRALGTLRNRSRSGGLKLFGLNTSASHGGGYIPAFNPGITGAVKSGFKPNVLLNVGQIGVGAIANKLLSEKAASFLPANWQSGWRASLVAAVTAGALGGAGAIASPKFGARLFAGGLMQAVTSFALPFIAPGSVAPKAKVPAAAAPLKGLDKPHHGDIIGPLSEFEM